MNQPFLDQPRKIRQGEELEVDNLQAFLKKHIPHLAEPLEIEQFPGGYSNLTYFLKAGSQEMVLRRPPFGAAIKSAHDMGREFRILSSLARVYGKVPHPVAYCEDTAVIGAPFYVMERVKGIILRSRKPKGLDLAPEIMHDLSTACVDNLAEIHGIEYGAAGLADLGRPDGYVARQVRGWTERYQNAKTDDVPAIDRAIEWLAGHQPEHSGAALIHNDYKYDNLVLDPDRLTRIIAVLDWEMATIGDPLMDLGTTLGYWVDPDDPDELQQAQFGLTTLPGNLCRRELVDRYAITSGRDVRQVVFYYVYALFKIAVIVQQIYKRFRLGHTTDERFAHLDVIVRVLGASAVRAIQRNQI